MRSKIASNLATCRVSVLCCIESTCRLARCPSVVALCVYTVCSEWPLLFEGIACPFAIQESLARRRCESRRGSSQRSQGISYSESFGIVCSRHCVFLSGLSVGLLPKASLVDCIVSCWLAILCRQVQARGDHLLRTLHILEFFNLTTIVR